MGHSETQRLVNTETLATKAREIFGIFGLRDFVPFVAIVVPWFRVSVFRGFRLQAEDASVFSVF